MRCKQAKHEIALSVGRDLVESAERRLQRHLAVCPDCREYRRELSRDLSVLDECEDETEHASVWPSVQRRLAELPAVPPSRPSYGWAPAFAVVAACLIMYVSMDPSWVPGQSSPIETQPISAPVLPPTPIIDPAEPQTDLFPELRQLQNRSGDPAVGRPTVIEYR